MQFSNISLKKETLSTIVHDISSIKILADFVFSKENIGEKFAWNNIDLGRDRQRIENKVRLSWDVKNMLVLFLLRLACLLHCHHLFCYQSADTLRTSNNTLTRNKIQTSEMEKLKDIIKSYFCVFLITIFTKGKVELHKQTTF